MANIPLAKFAVGEITETRDADTKGLVRGQKHLGADQ
jgi:hypothetical protein